MSSDVEKFVRFCETSFGKQILAKEVEYLACELRGYTNILDVGCGIGTFEQHLPHFNITGLDISEDMLNEARVRSEKTFIHGNAEDLPFDDVTFDAVFTVATLEFLDDYQQAITEIARVTKPQGKFVAMVLNPESEYFTNEILKPGDYFNRMKHLDVQLIKNFTSIFYSDMNSEYFLGIRDHEVFDTSDKKYASMFSIIGYRSDPNQDITPNDS
jgi:ubiquinone/menaquinone biosynthesis C-methylase UbiE